MTVLAGGTSAEELIEGLSIGIGTAIKPVLGLLIGLAIVVDNVSEALSIGEIIRSEQGNEKRGHVRRILGWTGLIGERHYQQSAAISIAVGFMFIFILSEFSEAAPPTVWSLLLALFPVELDGFAQRIVVELPQEVHEGRGVEFVVPVNDARVHAHDPKGVLRVMPLVRQDGAARELALPSRRKLSVMSGALAVKFLERFAFLSQAYLGEVQPAFPNRAPARRRRGGLCRCHFRAIDEAQRMCAVMRDVSHRVQIRALFLFAHELLKYTRNPPSYWERCFRG
ncbi:MAG TPA: hypothetical protein VLE20_03090 [Blastocatellia bacterium]|nr:hypothetical protein [Blastocatellia bacterium]